MSPQAQNCQIFQFLWGPRTQNTPLTLSHTHTAWHSYSLTLLFYPATFTNPLALDNCPLEPREPSKPCALRPLTLTPDLQSVSWWSPGCTAEAPASWVTQPCGFINKYLSVCPSNKGAFKCTGMPGILVARVTQAQNSSSMCSPFYLPLHTSLALI